MEATTEKALGIKEEALERRTGAPEDKRPCGGASSLRPQHSDDSERGASALGAQEAQGPDLWEADGLVRRAVGYLLAGVGMILLFVEPEGDGGLWGLLVTKVVAGASLWGSYRVWRSLMGVREE